MSKYESNNRVFQSESLNEYFIVLAIISCLIGRFSSTFIDYKVIFSLFGLMLLIQGFEEVGLLRYIGVCQLNCGS